MRSLESKRTPGLAWRGELRRELGGVFALRRLFGDSKHRSDFGPGTIGISCIANRFQQCGVDTISLFNQLSNRSKSRSLGLDKIVDVHPLGPSLQCVGSVCSRRRHGVHHPFRNLDRARIA
mgnify:FL=1